MSEKPVQPDAALLVPPRRRGVGQTVVWTLVIFLCGAVSGWGAGLLLPHRPPPLGPGEIPVELVVRAMTDELLLSPEQVHKVEEVYRARAHNLQAIRTSLIPRFQAEYDGLQADLKPILSPEQFKRWEIRFNAARGRMMPPPPSEHGPGFRPEQGPPGGFPGGPPGPLPDVP